jgi:predicted amidohydrolase YtcJ
VIVAGQAVPAARFGSNKGDGAMLIAGAELEGGAIADVRVEGGRVAAIGSFEATPGERVIAAQGRLLLPGLHDHHIHCNALAASLASAKCGPPDVTDEAGLAAALGVCGEGWLRGVGYHESVAGLLDRAMLDRLVPARPVRVQHRGGRMWFLNSAAIDGLLARAPAPPGLDAMTGRLFDEDAWLRATLGSTPPSLAAVGTMLAARGVTGLTDMTPSNDAQAARHFLAARETGALPQRVLLAGTPTLAVAGDGVATGPVKLHLHEAALPDYDAAVATIARAHDAARPVAVHCATEVELVFALAAIAEARAGPGDRIEHASVAPDTAIAEIARLGLAVVSQPHFVAERGDAYRADVACGDIPLLYRLRAFDAAGVPLAMGSDAPFGAPDPWASMAAAVSRRTASGATIGPREALTPERALDGWLADPMALHRRRRVTVGAEADLCLLDRDGVSARADLAAVRIAATWIGGRLVHDAVDEAPA